LYDKELKCNTIHEFIKNYRLAIDIPNIKTINGVPVENVVEYYDFERRIVNHIVDNRFSIIAKSRQMHMTTLLAAYTAWRMLHGKNVLYLSCNRASSQYFITKVKSILNNVGVNFEVDNKTRIEIEGGGKIYTRSNRVDALKGYSPDDLIMDEAAFIDNFEDIFSAGMTSLGTDGKCILASTPNSYNGFYKVWESAIKRENDFATLKITFNNNPRYDNVKWLNNMMEALNMDRRMIDQEIHAKFIPPLPKKKSKKKNKNNLIQFRIDEDLYLNLCQKLIDEDISVSQYMRKLLIENMDY
jgi:phage FluMu gp28-like protein